MTRVPPHNIEAEESLLGACTLNRDALRTARSVVQSSDFYVPAHSSICETLFAMYDDGVPCDVVTLTDELRRRDVLTDVGGKKYLLRIQAATPASANASHYAKIVREDAVRRRMIAAAGDMAEIAYKPGVDLEEQIVHADEAIARINVPMLGGRESVDVDTFVDSGPEFDWLVRGLLERLERVLIVAPEGFGKTQLLLQLALQLTQGIHPWTWDEITPVRALFVDLELPKTQLRRRLRTLTNTARDFTGERFDATRLQIISRSDGIDVTKPADHTWLIEQAMYARPDVIFVTPLYKLHESDENDARAARGVMKTLDTVRKQLGCALVMETHAPQAESGKKRRLRPRGSSVWLAWPDFGLSLEPDGEALIATRAVVGRWRGDRDVRDWPQSVRRGGRWPWSTSEL